MISIINIKNEEYINRFGTIAPFIFLKILNISFIMIRMHTSTIESKLTKTLGQETIDVFNIIVFCSSIEETEDSTCCIVDGKFKNEELLLLFDKLVNLKSFL